jgi:hypothetical protein
MSNQASGRARADLNDPDLRHLYELLSLLQDPAPDKGPPCQWWDAFADAGNRKWDGYHYRSKLNQDLDEGGVRNLAEYCLMFFVDLSDEQMKLLDQLQTPGAHIRGVGRVWAADMVATAWRVYSHRQAMLHGSHLIDPYRKLRLRVRPGTA